MKYFICTSLALALLLAGGQTIRAQQGGFGTLETASEASIKAEALSWLKDAGKTDQASMQRFETLWSQKDRTIIDRLGETFAIGNADAAKLLAVARNPQAIPSVKVPALLTSADPKENVFFRANLGLAYVRALTHRRAYDEGLDVLKLFQPEQVAEPSAYLFHRAVCEHALLMKADTTKSVNRLLQDAVDAPERYRTVSLLMLFDMETWQDKDLGAVARKMKRIEERLELAKAGDQTQKLQKEVALRLQELIKELENKAKKKEKDGPPKDGPKEPGPGGQPGDDGEPECPEGGDPQEGPPQGSDQAKKPATDSFLPPGKKDGLVNQADIKKLEQPWGSLPPRERERLLAAMTEGMSPSHRQAIENYFRNLALEGDRPEADRPRR